VTYGFSCVEQNVGLQAADLVAHETYQFFKKYIDDKNTTPSAHLRRLYEGAHDFRAAWVGKDQIDEMIEHIEPIIAKMRSQNNFS
jgi:hypothetical protein